MKTWMFILLQKEWSGVDNFRSDIYFRSWAPRSTLPSFIITRVDRILAEVW